ncbi:MAG: trigger factor [Opitutales bacterium]
MKTHIESINTVSKKVTVTFEKDMCKDVRLTVLKKAQKDAALPGFRKGKVPLELLEQRYAEALLQEFRQELVVKALEHLKQSDKMDVVAVVKSDFSDKDKGQELHLEVELAPEIALPDYKSFQLDKADFEVSEAEVNDFIERLQKQQASYEVVEREAQSKDYVKLSYEGFVDDQPIDSYQGLPHLWAKQKMTWEEVDAQETPGIPEIVKGIKGLKAGDKKEIKVQLPATFAVKELQKKKAVYKVEILEVREVKLPALDEEFFKKLQVKDKAELETFAKKTLSNRKEQEYAAQQKQRISEFLIQSVTCEMPSSWVRSETNKVLQEMVNLFSSHGIKQGMLEEQKEALVERARTVACDRIKLNLCFEKIFSAEKLKVDARDIELVLVQEAAQRHITPQKLLQLVQKDERERNAIQNKAFQAKMINWLFDTLRETSKK